MANLIVALFAVPGAETLYFQEDFVTVTTADGSDWRALHEQVKGVLESHYVDSEATDKMARASGPQVEADASGTATDDQDMLKQINELLDDRVRPALAGDGGGLEVLSLQNKHLAIRYQGACGSCPSSAAGTLRAIENLLQMEVDEELAVVAG